MARVSPIREGTVIGLIASVSVAAFYAAFVATIVMVGILSAPIRTVLPWWSIVLANTLAVLLAGSYLLYRHPGLWRRVVLRPA